MTTHPEHPTSRIAIIIGIFTFGAPIPSQFEQQRLAICGLPLGDSSLVHPVVTKNLPGNLWRNGPPRWNRFPAHSQVRLFYGNTQAMPGRKMSQFLLLAENPDQALPRPQTLLHRLTQENPAESGLTTENPTGDDSRTPGDDQKRGRVFELAGPGTHTAWSSFPLATCSLPKSTHDRLRPHPETQS